MRVTRKIRDKPGVKTRRLQRGGALPNTTLGYYSWPPGSLGPGGSLNVLIGTNGWVGPDSIAFMLYTDTSTPELSTVIANVASDFGAYNPTGAVYNLTKNSTPITVYSGRIANTYYRWVIGGLTPGTLYAITQLKPANASGTVTIPCEIYVRTLPSAVTTPTASNVTATGFTLKWYGGQGATAFYVVYTTTLTATGAATTTVTVPTAVTWFGTITGDAVNGYTAISSVGFPSQTTSLGIVPVNLAPDGTVQKPDASAVINRVLITFPPSKPVILTTTYATTTSIIVNWTAYAASLLTSISFKDSLTGNALTPSPAPGLTAGTATLTGLSLGTTYGVVITATVGGASADSEPMMIKTAPKAPVVTVTNRTTTGFTLNWQDVGATVYAYQGVYSPNTTTTNLPTPIARTATSATFTGFTAFANGAYVQNLIVYAYAANNGINTTAGTSATMSMLYLAPGTPVQAGTATVVTGTTYTFTVICPNANVLANISVTGAAGTPVITGSAGNYTLNFTGLTPGTNYSFTVTAGNYDNTATASATFTFLTAPDQPTNITFSNQTSNGFTINWTGGAGATSNTYSGRYMLPITTADATTINKYVMGQTAARSGYMFAGVLLPSVARQLYESDILTTITPMTPSSSTANSATFNNLLADKVYVISLSATNASGTATSLLYFGMTAPSASIATPTITTPLGSALNSCSIAITPVLDQSRKPTPTCSITSFSYTIDGVAVTPVENKSLYNRPSAGANLDTSNVYPDASLQYVGVPTTIQSLTAAFSGIGPGNHTLVVTGNSSSGLSSSSSVTLIFAPDKPVLSSSNVTYNQFTVTWTGGTDATTYTYTVNGATVTPNSTATKSATFTGLTGSTAYTIAVTATNSSGSSPVSSPLTITTLVAPPAAPILLPFTNITSSGFTVSWSGATRATSYSYLVNGVAATPVSTTANSVTFAGYSPAAVLPVIVTAINASGTTPSAAATVTLLTLEQQVALTAVEEASSAVQQTVSSAMQQTASSALQQQTSSAVQQQASSAVQQQASSAIQQQASSATQQLLSGELSIHQKLIDDLKILKQESIAINRTLYSSTSQAERAAVIQQLQAKVREILAKQTEIFAEDEKIRAINAKYEDRDMQTVIPDANLERLGYKKWYDIKTNKYFYTNLNDVTVDTSTVLLAVSTATGTQHGGKKYGKKTRRLRPAGAILCRDSLQRKASY